MKISFQTLTYLCLLITLSQNVNGNDNPNGDKKPTPIVIWHGMGDNCCHSFSMGRIKQILEQHIPGVYVTSLMIGESPNEDTLNGFFMPVQKQIELVCKKISEDKKLQNGFNGMGFSQGGQFMRAIAEVCPHGMKKLISFGGQHQGVYGLPNCPGENHVICDYVRRMLNYGAYENWIQSRLVQAQYWHDPLDEETYRKYSQFLSGINNAKESKNQTYKDNLTKLHKLVLVKFNQDSVVDPRGTEWFGYYKPGQGKIMLPYNETSLYTEDWIGLKKLDEEGKVDFLSVEGDHLRFTDEFFVHDIIEKYLLD